MLKQSQNLSTLKKDGAILKQCHNLLTVRKKDGTILKYLSPVRKRWYNTQTVPKPVTSQKKVIQYSNKANTCHQSEKDGTILKQSQNLSPVRKRWYNTETWPKPVNRQKKDGIILKQSQNLSPVRKRCKIL